MNNISACSAENNDIVCDMESVESEWRSLGCCDEKAVSGQDIELGSEIQGSAKRLRAGLVNFVPAFAYHFCLSLPAVFMQPGNHL